MSPLYIVLFQTHKLGMVMAKGGDRGGEGCGGRELKEGRKVEG